MRKPSQFEALNEMALRLRTGGGYPQQDRMIHDKRVSLDKAIKYSYQGAKIRVLGRQEGIVPALINPNKLKQDYDDKIVSIGFEYGLKPGMVFEWMNTGTKWLVYLQDLTELAYFRGDIRKCSHSISWVDEEGNTHTTFIAVRGPVETKITFIQKEGISVDQPNHSLNILMPLNEETQSYFKRYSKFYLQGLDTCWRVEATDSISIPGILEITAVEYYSNKITDDVENGIVNGLVIEPIKPEIEEVSIIGEGFIKPKRTYEFTYTGKEDASWELDSYLPLEKEINGKTIKLKWTKTYSGQFVLKYGSAERTIVVESLF